MIKFPKKQERKKQAQKRKDGLIEKYGKKFGEAVFRKKTLKGMTLPMVEDVLGKKKYNDENKYYFGKPFNRLITFADDKLDSDERLDKSIWLDMPKDMLVASWGDPADEKEDVSKDKVKLKLKRSRYGPFYSCSQWKRDSLNILGRFRAWVQKHRFLILDCTGHYRRSPGHL